jgi:hypothetical protein
MRRVVRAAVVSTLILTSAIGAAPVARAQTSTDFFVDRFGDALDYTNAEDVPLATSLVMKVANPSLDGGRLKADLNGAGWISLLWPGVPGAIPHGREGVINPIDASRYGRLVFRMNVTNAQPVIALWHTCAAANETCQGGTVLNASPGDQTYDTALVPVSGDPGLAAPWSGNVVGLRLLFPLGAGRVELDWVRLVPTGSEPVTERNDRRAEAAPDDSRDYATWAGNAWDFDDVDAITSGTSSSSISGGALRACNAKVANATGDAAFTLRLPSGFVDADRFHRLVVALRQDGPFSLEFGPGGGMNMRVVWRDGANKRHVSKDIVMYNNEATVSFDLRTTGFGPLGVDGASWSGRINELRIDPNEDPAARCWTVDRVWLLADDGVDLGPKPVAAVATTAAPTKATTKRPAVKRVTTKKRVVAKR